MDKEETVFDITSVQNAKVKQARKLWDRTDRDKTQRFLIEGFRELTRAVSGGELIETVFYCPQLFLGTQEPTLIRACQEGGAAVFACTKEVFSTLSYRDRPDGLVAVAVQKHRPLACLPMRAHPFFVVAVGIEKPGNLGTILRSADAAGVDGVIVCARVTDIHNPNVVRASTGTLFTVPVIEASSAETLEWLRAHHIAIVSATPSATEIYTQVSLQGPVALVVGAEQYGLPQEWLEGADMRVRIPMQGEADSLNVAMATTLLLFEVQRQRRASVL